MGMKYFRSNMGISFQIFIVIFHYYSQPLSRKVFSSAFCLKIRGSSAPNTTKGSICVQRKVCFFVRRHYMKKSFFVLPGLFVLSLSMISNRLLSFAISRKPSKKDAAPPSVLSPQVRKKMAWNKRMLKEETGKWLREQSLYAEEWHLHTPESGSIVYFRGRNSGFRSLNIV